VPFLASASLWAVGWVTPDGLSPICVFWPCSGLVCSKDKVRGWRESKYGANTVIWGITDCRFAEGLMASERC